jgi:hypothetical protein
MLFIPVDDRGAHVMVCDQTCYANVVGQFPAVEPLVLSTSVDCATCYCCSLTIEGTDCPCAGWGVSCSAPSWLLCQQAHEAISTIYEAAGPTVLTDADWEFLLAHAEEVWAGGLVGLLWVREHQPDPGR